MDYTSLIGSSSTGGSIANWGNTSQLVSAAPTIVAEAESFIYRRLRHWQMVAELDGQTMTIDSDTLALPTTDSNDNAIIFLEPKSLYIVGTNFSKLTMKTEEEVKSSYSYDSSGNRIQQMPEIYYFNATGIRMDSAADQAYPYELVYYQQLAPLSVTTTNFLTSSYPRLVRCACMAAACEFMKDAGMGNFDRTYWAQAAMAEMQIAQAESDRAARAMEVGMILR